MKRSIIALFLSQLVSAQNETTTTQAAGNSTVTTAAATTDAATTQAAGNTTATTAAASTAAASTAAASTAAASTAEASTAAASTAAATNAASTAAATNPASTAAASNTASTSAATSASLPTKLEVTATINLCSDNQVSEATYKLVMCSTMFGVTINSFNDTFTAPTGSTCTLSGFSATAGTCSRRRGRQLGAGYDHTGNFVFGVADPSSNTALYNALDTKATVAAASGTVFKTLVQTAVAGVPAVNGFGTVQSSTTTQSIDDGTSSGSGAATFFVGQVFAIMASYLYIAM